MNKPETRNKQNLIINEKKEKKENKENKITEKKQQIVENKLNCFKTDKYLIEKKNAMDYKQREENKRQQEKDYRNFMKEQQIKKVKEDEIKNITDLNNFPELKTKQSKYDSVINMNNDYFNKLLNMEDNNKIKEKENQPCLPDGCVSIEFDKSENKIKWTYGKNCNNNSLLELKEKDDPILIMGNLVDLYKERRNNYIKKWGFDEYEKMFLFPNYDYDYFEKLDEEILDDIIDNNNTIYYDDYYEFE
jgi:hypothetical protein